MANTTALSPSAAVNDTGVGTVTWVNPANVYSSNDVRATVSLGGGQVSNLLKATGFGFAIPSAATINGVVAAYECASGAVGARDHTIQLVKAGTAVGTNKADTVNIWPTTEATLTRGGATDLWGTAITPADVNAADFGVAIACIRPSGTFAQEAGRIDHITLTVYYTDGSGGGEAVSDFLIMF